MEPAAQGIAGVDRARLAGQDQERGLESVLRIVVVAQDGAAGRRDHRPVPRHQGREGRAIVRCGIAAQQLPVADPDRRTASEEVAEVLQAGS